MQAAVERRATWIFALLLFLTPGFVAAGEPVSIRLGLCHSLSDLSSTQVEAVISHLRARLVSAGLEVFSSPPGLDGRCCASPDCLTTTDGKPLDALLSVTASRTGPVVKLSFSLFSEKEARVVYQDSKEATLAELKSFRALDEPEKGILEAVRVLLAPAPAKVVSPPKNPPPVAPVSTRPDEGIVKTAPAAPGRLWAHLTLWSGVALVTFGGISAALSKAAADNYAESPTRQTWDRSRLWAGMMWAGFGAGAALVTTGVVLWLRGGTPRENPSSAFVVSPAGAGGGLTLGWQGRF